MINHQKHFNYVIFNTKNKSNNYYVIFKQWSCNAKPVSMEHLIALLTPQCSEIPLMTPKMFPVWDFVVRIFGRKPLLNIDCIGYF